MIHEQFTGNRVPAVQFLLLDTDPRAQSGLADRESAGLTADEMLTLPLRRPQHYRERKLHIPGRRGSTFVRKQRAFACLQSQLSNHTRWDFHASRWKPSIPPSATFRRFPDRLHQAEVHAIRQRNPRRETR